MKIMTCKQLGGACDLAFKADTFEEMTALSKQHGMDMYQKGDEAHLKAMNEMKELMKNPEAMHAWMEEKKREFNTLPDEKRKTVTVTVEIEAPIEKVWEFWTEPEHITHWNFAQDDWECPSAENDLRKDGRFNIRMAAKDGSAGFDFEGTYTHVKTHQIIEYVMSDGRKVNILFDDKNGMTHVTETFDIELIHSEELQRSGWQAILDNFKKYVESD
jgi:uncharacterized protein YndB with AHSA1/START domain